MDKKLFIAIVAQGRAQMAKFIARVAKEAKFSEKQTEAVLTALKMVLQEQLATQPNQKIHVSGLFTAVALQKPRKEARTKKVFGKTMKLPPREPYTVVKLVPSRKLCVTRAEGV